VKTDGERIGRQGCRRNGAASDIGLGNCEAKLAAGARVVMVDRDGRPVDPSRQIAAPADAKNLTETLDGALRLANEMLLFPSEELSTFPRQVQSNPSHYCGGFCCCAPLAHGRRRRNTVTAKT
jgi:NAD(P)-dependent dehydrogenase (short-subunit alcohol dehydrogenase family)